MIKGFLSVPPLRSGLDGQHDVEVCSRRRSSFRDRYDLGAQQADRGAHHLCPGGRGGVASAGNISGVFL